MNGETEEKPKQIDPVVEAMLKVTQHADNELEKIHKFIRIAGQLISAIVFVGTTFVIIIGSLTYRSMEQFKDGTRKEAEREVDRTQKFVQTSITDATNHINAELALPKIRALITNAATQLITADVKEEMGIVITNTLSPIERGLAQRLNYAAAEQEQMRTNLLRMKDLLKEVELLSEFTTIVAEAQQGSRGAFERLERMASDNDYRYKQKALEAYRSVAAQYTLSFPILIKFSSTNDFWKSMQKYDRIGGDVPPPDFLTTIPKEHVTSFISLLERRTDVALGIKLHFLNAILTDSNDSIYGAHHAAIQMASLMGKSDLYPTFFDFSKLRIAYLNWVTTNQAPGAKKP